jgi:tetratricopeptide (TPR) repeat protein
MKDPLHLEKTPYDILEIAENADKTAIETGFKNAVVRKSLDASTARRTLLDPTDRALEDLFLYNNDYLAQMQITEATISQLKTNRTMLSRQWGELNKKNFPEIGPPAFCLAVLLYWWAMNEEEYYWGSRSGNRNRESIPGSPVIELLWQQNIAYWVSIINSEHAVLSWLSGKNHYHVNFTTVQAKAICDKLATVFPRIFDKYAQRYQDAGDPSRMQIYRTLELSYNTELDTARKIREIGFKQEVNGRSYPVYCGKFMLQEVEQLGYIRSQLEVLKQAYAKDQRILKIIDKVAISLSEYHYITLMINNKDFDGALKAIEGLSIFERSKQEVKDIHATALFEKGRNLMESDMVDEAMALWRELKSQDNLSAEYVAEIVKAAKAKAASLMNRDPSATVKLVEECLTIVKQDSELKQLLAMAYSRKGLQKLNQTVKKLEKDKDLYSAREGFETAIADLEKSIKLNPSDAEASKNLQQAKEFLSQINSRINENAYRNAAEESLKHNNEGIQLLKEAEEEAKNGNKNAALGKAMLAVFAFKEAHNSNPGDEVIEKNVAIANDWVKFYSSEGTPIIKDSGQKSVPKKTNYALARTFFILAIICFVLLLILDKKIL